MRTRALVVLVPFLPLVLGACGAKSPPGAPMSAYEASPRSAREEASGGAYGAPKAEATSDADGETAMPAAPPPATPAGVSARARSDARPIAPTPTPGGTIKAGEWDDNANFREYGKWLATEESQPFHRVDVSERRFLVVRDAQGKAVPRCRVTVADEKQHQVMLTTTASGHAVLFPRAEGLQGRDMTASASCEGSTATARFALSEQDGMVDLKLATARTLDALGTRARTIDVAFILDTTGSMAEEITAVKSTIQKVASSLDGGAVHVRIGMVAFKDRGDAYVTRVYPMTTNLQAFQKDVADIRANGGGDIPESVNEGIHVALTKLDWGQDAVAKMAFLVGDAPPHLDYAQDFDYAVDMKDAAHRGIQIVTVAASGMDVLGQIVWRQIAAYTNATNLFVMRGGAGPQSTGAGDPRSSCGGTQTSYASGNLDVLILQKIRQELKSIDRDPTRIAGLGMDESAKPCSERLVARD